MSQIMFTRHPDGSVEVDGWPDFIEVSLELLAHFGKEHPGVFVTTDDGTMSGLPLPKGSLIFTAKNGNATYLPTPDPVVDLGVRRFRRLESVLMGGPA